MKAQLLRNKPGTPRLAALVLVAVLSTLSFEAFAEDIDGLSYTISGTEATVTGFASGASDKTTVTIPATVGDENIPVTAIKENAFYNQTQLTSVTIEGNNLTKIGGHAFDGCSGLTSINIPGSVTTINASAFVSCSSDNFEKVIIEDLKAWCGIEFGGNTANPLYYANNLYSDADTKITDLEIPNGVEKISGFAFYNCKNLTSVTIPGSVKTISYHVFNGCSNLAKVTMNEGLTSIGNGTFDGCKELTSVTIPNSVTKIDYGAFSDCAKLKSLTIGNGVTDIAGDVFKDCTLLESVTIGSKVEDIGAGAFKNCSALKTITSLRATPPTIVSENKSEYIGEYTMVTSYATFDGVTVSNVTLYVPAGSGDTYKGKDGWSGFKIEELPKEEEKEEEEEEEEVSPLEYNLINEGRALEVTKKDGGYSGSIVIPASAKYNGSNELPVTSIGKEAFKDCGELTSIEIPSSVTSIGTFAFKDCEGLTSVTIPSSVTSIGEYAFSGCTNITKVTSNIQKPFAISSNVFNLTVEETATLYVPERTKNAYQTTAAWSEFKTIDDGTKEEEEEEEEEEEKSPLEYNLINDGRALEVTKKDGGYSGSINIPASAKYNGIELPVTSIGKEAFKDCTELTSIEIPSSVTGIGSSAFQGCSSLTSVTIPSGITSIGSYTFYGCAALGTITSLSVEPPLVGEYAFYGCDDIETIYVPKKSVSKYQDAGFWGDYNIVALPGDDDEEEEEEEEEDTEPDISERNDDGKIVYFNFADNTQEVKVTKGDYWGVVSIPETVHNIPVTGIESDAFSGCTELTGITIPRSVTTIGDNAFNGCSSLEAITIRSTIEAIGADAFSGCIGLEKVVAEDIPAWCNISFGNEAANPLTQAGHLYSDENREIKDLVISENVENIGAHAFAGGIGLESVTVQNGAKNIGAGAFDGCVNITSVTIPSSVESIGSDAFSDCVGLKKVVAEDIAAWCDINFGNVESNPLSRAGHIYSDEYTEITDLTIPNTVQGIGEAAFAGGIGLRSVTIGSNPESDLKSMEYYDGVKEIANSAFYGCSNLVSVTLRSSVESIGAFAFCDCDRLDSIAIPSGVTTIGDMAFYCSNITKVVSHIENPFAIKASVFGGNTLMNGTLYVPDETLLKYKSTAGWKEFRHIVGKMSTGIEDINTGKVTIQSVGGALHISGVKDGTRVTVYSMTGAKVSETTVAGGTASIPTALRGGDIAIVRIGDAAVKVIMQ